MIENTPREDYETLIERNICRVRTHRVINYENLKIDN